MAGMDSTHIDRGWALVIAFSYFMTKVLLSGISYPSSVFYSVFLEEFDQLPSSTAWATSLNTFSLCFFGEVANIISSSLGCRITTIIGCVMSSIGLLLTSFAPNLLSVTFAYGLLTGMGFCLAFISSYPMVAVYFQKYRKLVFVIGGMGYSVGIFLFPILTTSLIDRYHWRGAFMILSAINLNLLVIGATYIMPPRSATKASVIKESLLEPEISAKAETKRQCAFSYLQQSVSLLKHKRYCLYLLSYVLYGIGSNTFYTHVGNMAMMRGITKEQAALLPSVVGIAGILGRLPLIIFTHVINLHVVGLFSVYFILVGLSIVALAFMNNFHLMIACCAAVGFLLCVIALQAEVLIEIVGLKNMSTGVSYSTMLFGVGSMLGGPLSGLVLEVDPTYRSSFLFSGAAFFISGAINIPSWLRSRKKWDEESLFQLQPN